jgi:predicted Zn finger-like uncharacterized protein
MIVTCPSCSARYKISETKIKGRGAKITCPRCAHRFVVYRDQAGSGVPDDIDTHDFGALGITWRVRKGIGMTYQLTDLQTLKGFMRDGQIEKWDQITFDNRAWTSIDAHDSLEELFWDVWQRAQRGEITIHPPEDDEGGSGDDEDDSDAPTTIVGRGSSLASEIRQAVGDAATPAPMPNRDDDNATGQLLLDDEEAEVDEDDEDRKTVMHSTPPVGAEFGALLDDQTAPPAPSSSRPPSPAPAPAPAAPAVHQPDEPTGPSFGVIAAVVLMLLVLGAAGLFGSGVFGSTPSVPKAPAPVAPAPAPAP